MGLPERRRGASGHTPRPIPPHRTGKPQGGITDALFGGQYRRVEGGGGGDKGGGCFPVLVFAAGLGLAQVASYVSLFL